MKDLKVSDEDLKILFLHSKEPYGNVSFSEWREMVRRSYLEYSKKLKNPKTYSQWVNLQIIALTMPI